MHVSNLPLHKFQKSAGNLPPGIPLGSFFVRNSAAKARAAHPKLPPSSNNAAPAGRSLGPGRFKRQSHRGLRARYSLPEPLPLEPFLSGLSTCFFPLEHFSPAFSALSAHRSSPPPLRPSLSAVVPPTHFVTSRRPPAPLRRTQSPAVFPPTLSTIHPSCLPAPLSRSSPSLPSSRRPSLPSIPRSSRQLADPVRFAPAVRRMRAKPGPARWATFPGFITLCSEADVR